MAYFIEFLARGTTQHFQPNPALELTTDTSDSRIQKRLALLVGWVALGLPVIMAAGATFGQSCFRDSISHFYYAQFLGSIFVGLLVFIGGFLIAYTGEHWLEDVGSVIAGVGACFIAVFPTTRSGCENQGSFLTRVFVEYTPGASTEISPVSGHSLFQLFSKVDNLHAYAAAALFIYLGLYCLVVLKRVVPERHMHGSKMTAIKRQRNTLYSICGLLILACVAVLGVVAFLVSVEFRVKWNAYNLTFIVETIALWAFACAWLTKGRRFTRLNDAAAA